MCHAIFISLDRCGSLPLRRGLITSFHTAPTGGAGSNSDARLPPNELVEPWAVAEQFCKQLSRFVFLVSVRRAGESSAQKVGDDCAFALNLYVDEMLGHDCRLAPPAAAGGAGK